MSQVGTRLAKSALADAVKAAQDAHPNVAGQAHIIEHTQGKIGGQRTVTASKRTAILSTRQLARMASTLARCMYRDAIRPVPLASGKNSVGAVRDRKHSTISFAVLVDKLKLLGESSPSPLAETSSPEIRESLRELGQRIAAFRATPHQAVEDHTI